MIWNALVLVTVMVPLASLTIDVPRYFILRSRLQLAVDAAAEATAACIDLPHFQASGEVRLEATCLATTPGDVFNAALGNLRASGYSPSLTAVQVNEVDDWVTVQGQGTTRIFFGMVPGLTVHTQATSRFRMDRR